MPLYVGIMSGTSLDGIDVALINVSQQPISSVKLELVCSHTVPFDASLRQSLTALMQPNLEHSIATIGTVQQALASAFSQA